jgi:hypothetical protein
VTDDEFLARVESAAGGAPPHGFHFGHPDHLRLAWLQHDRLGREAGGEATAATLRRLDALHGGGKYHETITRFWLELIWHAGRRFDGRSFETVLAEHPQLLDGSTLSRHYSPQLLASADARRSVVAPDLEPVPWEAGPAAAR